jgi:hypothetical protein
LVPMTFTGAYSDACAPQAQNPGSCHRRNKPFLCRCPARQVVDPVPKGQGIGHLQQ